MTKLSHSILVVLVAGWNKRYFFKSTSIIRSLLEVLNMSHRPDGNNWRICCHSYGKPLSSLNYGEKGGNDYTNKSSSELHLRIRQGWEEVAEEYAQDRLGIFERSATRLLELLHPPSATTLLDVGCGTGVLDLQAADWVGNKGTVIGSDIAAAMVRLGHKNAEGKVNISFGQMDAEYLGFASASFDILACAFSLFQFPDMERALNEMWRTLKPGGHLGLSNWGRGYFSPIASLQRDLFREHGIKPLLTNPIVFEPAALDLMLRKAGFQSIELIEETYDIWFASPQQAWAFNMDMGPFPMMLRQQLSNEKQSELMNRFMAMLEELETERGIKSTFHVLYTMAEKEGID